jgi:hypothetical protein
MRRRRLLEKQCRRRGPDELQPIPFPDELRERGRARLQQPACVSIHAAAPPSPRPALAPPPPAPPATVDSAVAHGTWMSTSALLWLSHAHGGGTAPSSVSLSTPRVFCSRWPPTAAYPNTPKVHQPWIIYPKLIVPWLNTQQGLESKNIITAGPKLELSRTGRWITFDRSY